MNKSISIPEWHRMAAEGTAPPVRIQLNGGSMHPLVRWNRDYVTIVPLQEMPVAGDIVLFCPPETGKYIVHRVWEVKDGKILIWGDNCPVPDGWFLPENVWGKVTLIERGRRTIHPDPEKGLKWVRLWRKIRPAYQFKLRIKQAVARRIKRIKKGKASGFR